MLKRYSYKRDKNLKLDTHFKVGEFKCKDGSDEIFVNSDLIIILEKLYDFLFNKYKIKSININSGYRTPSHSIKVGGYATDQHTKGNAADINVKVNSLKRLSAKQICLALEDLKHNGGVGYINSTSVHVDVRGKKVYFDETKNEKTTKSWYTYFGIKKPIEKKDIVYIVKKGDTLTSIAKKYKTTVTKIAKDNRIKNVNIISIGQRLIIK